MLSTSRASITALSRTLQNSSELAALFLRNFPVGAAQQDIGLDADRAQFFHRMLRRLGLQLAGARDERQQRQVNVDRMTARQIVLDLADRLEERQALDVAHRAADLAQHEIIAVVAVEDEILDGVGDVRESPGSWRRDSRRAAPWSGCPDRCGRW